MRFRYKFLFSVWNVAPSSLETILHPSRIKFYLVANPVYVQNCLYSILVVFEDKHGTCYFAG